MGKRQNLRMIAPVAVKQRRLPARTRRAAPRSISRKFPAPFWHKQDGGPYIGSGSLVIMRDPDTGWINASIYRVQVHGRNKVTVQFDHPGRHGAIIAKKYWDDGKPCPLAVVNGEDPALFIAGFEYLPEGASEYDFAGAIKGAPIEIYPGPVTGLPVPALAEIILEGELLPPSQETLPEGPVRRVHRLLRGRQAALPRHGGRRPSHHRDDPILLGSPPMKPPRFHFGLPFRAAGIWSNLETGRRHRRHRRVAARRAADDRGGAAPALRRPRQARRADRGGATATWAAWSWWSTTTSIRPTSTT